MLHTKFRGNRSAGSGEEDFQRVFTIYGHGGHLGHVTSIMSSMTLTFNTYKPSYIELDDCSYSLSGHWLQ